MKVAYLLHRFPVLSETFIQSELMSHVAAGLDVTIVSFAPPEPRAALPESHPLRSHTIYLHPPGGMLQYIGQLLRNPLANVRALRAAMAIDNGSLRERLRLYRDSLSWDRFRKSFDIVHCHFGNHGRRLAALKAGGQLNALLVTTFHGADVSRQRGQDMSRYYRQLFATGDLFLPISEHWARKLRNLGCPPQRIAVQRMGLDLASLAMPLERGTSAEVVITGVGRCVEKKGHEYTVRAIALLRDRRPDLLVKARIVGDGPLLASLQALASDLGVARHVSFLGARTHEQTLELLADSDIAVLPSVTASDGDQEGIPVALMEAMALRVPVLTTYHSGIPELVEHGVSGLLSAERDVATLAKHLEQLCDDPALRLRLGSEGRAKVLSTFNMELLGPALRDRYHQLLNAQPAARSGQEGSLPTSPE